MPVQKNHLTKRSPWRLPSMNIHLKAKCCGGKEKSLEIYMTTSLPARMAGSLEPVIRES